MENGGFCVSRNCIRMHPARISRIRIGFTGFRAIGSRWTSREESLSANSTSAQRSCCCLRLQRTFSSPYQTDRRWNTDKYWVGDTGPLCPISTRFDVLSICWIRCCCTTNPENKAVYHIQRVNSLRQFITRTRVIWQKVESLLVCICWVAAAICYCMFWLGFDTEISSSPGGVRVPPSNTMCRWTPQVFLPNGI